MEPSRSSIPWGTNLEKAMQPMRHLFTALLLCSLLTIGRLAGAPAENAVAGELDEFLGDTVVVGVSQLDNQHNILNGRTIVYNPDGNEGLGEATIIFTDLDPGARNVRTNFISEYDGELGAQFPTGNIVSNGIRGGYATIGMSPSDGGNIPIPTYHDRISSGAPWKVFAASYWTDFSLWNPFATTPAEDISMVQAKSAVDGDSLVHIVYMPSADESPRIVYYHRLVHQPDAFTFAEANDGGEPEIVTNLGYANCTNIACSPDGERVVIGRPMRRSDMGSEFEGGGWDTDLVLWLNDERGTNWDFSLDNTINITQFADPNPDLLPDSLAADVDTFRMEYEHSLFVDEDHVIHVAFQAMPFYYYEQRALILGQIYYWNSEDQEYIRIADGDFWVNAVPGGYNSTVNNPSLSRDSNGWLWCLYQQFGIPGDTLDDGTARDIGESSGLLNAELFVTASPPGPYNGRLWFKGVNITNTRGESGAIPAGDCRNERDATLALNNQGEYLHISFLEDLDAGNTDMPTPEGTVTNNPLVYMRILKQDLIDQFAANEELIPGYPLHVDSSGHHEDPDDWAWRDLLSAGEASDQTLTPQQFELTSAWPNPFNATVQAAFTLARAGAVQLKVYDVLGREVATLVDRTLQSGAHEVTFHGDGLAAGVYFLSLESGGHRDVVKVTLLK